MRVRLRSHTKKPVSGSATLSDSQGNSKTRKCEQDEQKINYLRAKKNNAPYVLPVQKCSGK